MKRSQGATYLTGDNSPKTRSLKSPVTTWIALVAAVFVLFTGLGIGSLIGLDKAQTQNSSNILVADAGLGITCSTVIGGNMDKRSNWGGGIISIPLFPDMANRQYTLNEVAGSSAWTNYTGIGDGGDDFFIKSYKDVLKGKGLTDGALDDENADKLAKTYENSWGNVKGKLEAERNSNNCFFGQLFAVNVANFLGLGLANSLQTFVGWIATTSFNTSFICDPAQPAATGCIDLVKVIGGRDDSAFRSGGDGGLIGQLTNGIFKPLVLIVVLWTAVTVGYTGIAKRQFRNAIGQALWLCLSFIIGLTLLLNPSKLAQAPMVVSNTITGCVIGAINGENCFDNSNFSTTTDGAVGRKASEAVCISEGSSSPSQKTAMQVNSMSCTIWRTFILQNYSKGAFGTTLDQLETRSTDTVAGKAIAATNGDVNPEDFCYQLGTTSSYSKNIGSTLKPNKGDVICNLATYNMLMQLDIQRHNGGEIVKEFDSAWYDLVVTSASNDVLWQTWTGDFNKVAQGFIAVISVLLGGVLIVVVSLTALMYYLAAVILLIFAPLFILVGLNPGRGKKIMLGWLESILSAMLKYLASAIFLLVALALYSAVIGAADPFMALIFVVILSAVLWMYRKEVIEMFSKVNMGGERMGSLMDKNIPLLGASANNLKDKAGRLPAAALGGVAGGFAANGARGAWDGARSATSNELRSTQGAIGRTFQTAERQMAENKRDLNQEARIDREGARAAEEVSKNDTRALDDAIVNEKRARDAVDATSNKLESAERDHKDALKVESDMARELNIQDALSKGILEAGNELKNSGQFSADAATYKQNEKSIETLSGQARAAEARGDSSLALDLRAKRDVAVEKKEKMDRMIGGLNEAQSYRLQQEFASFDEALNDKLREEGFVDKETGKVMEYSANKHANAAANLTAAEAKTLNAEQVVAQTKIEVTASIDHAETALDTVEVSKERARASTVQAAEADSRSKSLTDSEAEMGPGRLPTAKTIKKVRKNADETRSEAGAKAGENFDNKYADTPKRSTSPARGIPVSRKPRKPQQDLNNENSSSENGSSEPWNKI